ncbi:MAG: hypothetical protein Q9P01_07125 [Anaerolineae bacterium]|nr:hypothetical protein [Anaerolineae bacterium]
MNNNVRLGVEAVLVVVLIIALFLYFGQQKDLTDSEAALATAVADVDALESANEAQASDITDLEAEVADAETVAEEQENIAATAMADVDAAAAQIEEAQTAADAAATAQSDAEAAAEEQENIAATAMADAETAADAQADAEAAAETAAQAQADAEAAAETAAQAQADAEAAAETAAQAQADAEAVAETAAQEAADLQATIDAMNAATPEPTATEEAATEEPDATEEATADVVGFPADVFSMDLGEDYTVYNLTGDDREASLEAIAATDGSLANRLSRQTAFDYAALQGAGESVLVNQQALPTGVTGVANIANVAFRRADSSEIVMLGENEVARGLFSANEARYILIDGGSMWVLTFNSADVEANLAAFDAAVASFNAVEPIRRRRLSG